MQLKLFIEQLQALYATYDDEYKQIAGEPEIMVDCFVPKHQTNGEVTHFHYAGISGNVEIHKSSDGVYDIINAWKA